MTDSLSFEDVRKMRRGTSSYEIFNFPFMDDVYIGMRILTQDEIIKATNIGREKAKKLFDDLSNGEAEAFATKEMLFMSVVKATSDTECTGEPFFSKPEDVGELNMDEINLLQEHYVEVQRKYTPFVDVKTPEDFENLISDLKKKPQIGTSLSSYTLRQLALYLIAHSMKSQKDSDSISSPVMLSKTTEKKKPMKKELRGIKVLEPVKE